jgi:hypothetical protein
MLVYGALSSHRQTDPAKLRGSTPSRW